MPASKQAHVLAVLRKQLSLKQNELAELVGCSVSTIQSIELNRLQLSKGLAARISLRTGIDMDWLLANDVAVPAPPLKGLLSNPKEARVDKHSLQINLLQLVFDRLFAIARRQPKTEGRRILEMFISWQLDHLKKSEADPEAEHLFSTAHHDLENKERDTLGDPDFVKMINFDYLIEDDRKRQELALKEDRRFDREWKALRKAIKAKPADQLSEDEKAFLKTDEEGKKFRGELNAQVKTEMIQWSELERAKAETARSPIVLETVILEPGQAPKRSRRSI